MDLLKEFQKYIIDQNLFQVKDRLIIAVSGGVDSVVLCELCKQSGYDFAIAHCNFQLRGEESEADELFVKKLSEKYQVDFFFKKFDTEKYAADKKIGIQEAARDTRYNWFRELIHPVRTDVHPGGQSTSQPFNYLLTAHHANDNVETLLMNFFKGTGMQGLEGILPKNIWSVRPLLFAKKEQIREFAKEHKLASREDSSNSSNKYTRNYFRNELIPAIEKVYPQVIDNLLDNIKRFRDIHTIYGNSIQSIKDNLIIEKEFELHIPVLKLLQTPALPTVVYEIIKDHGFGSSQVNEVIKLLRSESGKYIQSESHRILHNRKWLIISPLHHSQDRHFIIEEDMHHVMFPGARLKIEKTNDKKIVADQQIALLDASLIKFPLLLRKWKQGDYFYPLGMRKKKKLSRFFVDQKLSMNQKEATWVIEMNKKIVWIVGQRIDDRFKINDRTKEVLKITLAK